MTEEKQKAFEKLVDILDSKFRKDQYQITEEDNNGWTVWIKFIPNGVSIPNKIHSWNITIKKGVKV